MQSSFHSTPAATLNAAGNELGRHPLLSRLFWLRWATIAGELLVLAGAHFWLEIALPLFTLLALIGMQAAINVATGARMRWTRPASQVELFLQLLLDLAALSALLFFSGGATNPFVSFYLPALAAGAATLAWPYALALALCALAAYSGLVYFYEPLHIHDHGQAMAYHLAGMWINFSISALLITWFVTRIAAAVRSRDGQLAQAREHQLQSQRIVALGTQAAGAAHALNTPLSTVAVIAGEMRRDMVGNAALALYEEDLRVVEEQIAVCKAALESMRLDADAQADQVAALSPWLATLIDGWRLRHPAVSLAADLRQEGLVAGQLQDLSQILLTLLDNAAHAVRARGTQGEVRIALLAGEGASAASAAAGGKASQKTAIIRIADNGAGIGPELLQRLGHGPVASSSGGKGIGLMLAFAAASHMGGKLRLRSTPGEGATAELRFPLA
ncbi:sensor histidine kinase [Herbaspirillum sp. LeCh32-8]|uniref:ATP-binding protein n=1 Tax=Herbaspirillum sp. LeCh32-8 TaxID=2821356 RepID=UPI001AE363DF|nr:ATP-binding protein [Herbaspirillum sp. LeCh32-8]MBP0599381.1 sensor histidine kinase [Herbaspirillum sp. LeCh32-8]